MSEKGMQILARKQLLPEVKGTVLKPCEHCLAGKQHRVAFKRSSAHRTNNVLDLVYSDVCGPMKVSSIGGKRYFVTFIDDYSKKVWVYALRTKDCVFEAFKLFQANVKRETETTLKCVRTDNCGEYWEHFMITATVMESSIKGLFPRLLNTTE